MLANVKALWQARRIHGLELFFDTTLLALRYLSLSYWLRDFFPGPEDPRHTVRDNVIDLFCILQLLVVVFLLLCPLGPILDSVVAGYILFDIYLNLFNIVFIGKLREINAPPVSVERSLLLLFVNVLDVVFAFGVFYRDWLGLSTVDGVFNAVLVLGTVGYPSATGNLVLLVALQVLVDFVLVVLVVSSFVGQVGLFRPDAER